MKYPTFRYTRKAVFLSMLWLFGCVLAQAQATRTWVSGVGDDANPCSRTAPCKTFAGAISKTAAGGEISVLDPGGYGAVTITKAITINGAGTLAGILVSGTNGIIVNAGVNDEVIIRNVSIVGAGTGLNGIRYLAGNQLTVENVTINGFTGRGVDASLTNGGKLYIKDTNITNCGGSGFFINTAAGVAVAYLDNVRSEGNVNGLESGAGSTFVSISRSAFITNTSNGLVTNGPGVINIENSSISFNANGVNAAGGFSTIRITNNGIFHNGQGVKFVGGATVASDGSNRIDGNGSTQAPNGTVTKQ